MVSQTLWLRSPHHLLPDGTQKVQIEMINVHLKNTHQFVTFSELVVDRVLHLFRNFHESVLILTH
jgi:hypothetical protein